MEAVVADLQKQLAKRSSFESASAALASLFRDRYASATPSEQKAMYAAACRAATLLQTRYTGKGFWLAGQNLFEEAGDAITDPKEQENMRKYVIKAREFLGEDELETQGQNPMQMRAGPSTSYLFEGQLSVGPEPPPPAWLVAQNALAALAAAEQEPSNTTTTTLVETDLGTDVAAQIQSMMQTLTSLQEHTPGLEEAIQATLQELTPKGPPPASKDEVAKLPVVDVTEPVLKNLGEGTECAVCREVLILNDKMQEMPCKHYFHPPCLKPWLDEHNSCPICRYEMKTDDHEYESRKEREAEAEAERKGAANAVPAGELMYI